MSSTIYNSVNDFVDLSTNSMKLDETTITKFKVAKEFSENKARINSIDYSLDGKSLISSSDDDTIVMYDCEKGLKKRDIMSKKYGVDLIRYTHATNTAIYTSTKEDDTIRYLSTHDNKYLRYFKGHEKRVVSLAMSPADDRFLSGSLDNSLRLWDLKSDKLIGKIITPGAAVANYDPEGLIFAVGVNNDHIRLYDSRLYEKGPFSMFRISAAPPPNILWKSLKFSPNGKQILITTNYEELFILDAFSGQPLHKLTVGLKQPSGPTEYPSESCYSPDSQFILCGAQDGSVHVWSSKSGVKLTQLKPETKADPADPVQCVMFNPKFMMIASASTKMSFWIPTMPPSQQIPL